MFSWKFKLIQFGSLVKIDNYVGLGGGIKDPNNFI